MGVIGVVAALTMPALIQNYQKQVTVNRLKKAYAVLSNAFKLAEREYGDVNLWVDWNDAEVIIRDYLMPNLKGAKEYGKNSSNVKSMCYESDRNLHHNSDDSFQYKWLGDVWITSPFYADITASVRLADGTCVGINPKSDDIYSNYVFIDINGSNNLPNKAGRDLFFFYIDERGNLKPVGDTWSTEELTAEVGGYGLASGACNKKNLIGGRVCAAKIINDGWKIKYDW